MNYLDLFSGIGGFHEGLKQTGFIFNWTGFSEIDKYAKQIYQKHFPESEDLGDVRTIRINKLPRIDLITFGFPCQDLSIAGKRLGLRGERSGLFGEAIRIIRDTRPSYFIFENVKGLFSSNSGRDFEHILRTISDIRYDGQWQLLNTRWVLPQNRERIYFVGHIRGKRRPEIFPIEKSDFVSRKKDNSKQGCEEGICSTIDSRYGSLRNAGKTYLRQVGMIGEKNGQGQRIYDVNGISCQLTANGGGQGAKTGLYAILRDNQGGNIKKRIVPANTNPAWSLGGCETVVGNESSIRRLTPLECERLQGFDDGWTEGISDTQRYKCLGNAVTVPIVKLVGQKLAEYVKENLKCQ